MASGGIFNLIENDSHGRVDNVTETESGTETITTLPDREAKKDEPQIEPESLILYNLLNSNAQYLSAGNGDLIITMAKLLNKTSNIITMTPTISHRSNNRINPVVKFIPSSQGWLMEVNAKRAFNSNIDINELMVMMRRTYNVLDERV